MPISIEDAFDEYLTLNPQGRQRLREAIGYSEDEWLAFQEVWRKYMPNVSGMSLNEIECDDLELEGLLNATSRLQHLNDTGAEVSPDAVQALAGRIMRMQQRLLNGSVAGRGSAGAPSPAMPSMSLQIKIALCQGHADTSAGGHRPLGDCGRCARFSQDCGHPGDGTGWIDRPVQQTPCPQFVDFARVDRISGRVGDPQSQFFRELDDLIEPYSLYERSHHIVDVNTMVINRGKLREIVLQMASRAAALELQQTTSIRPARRQAPPGKALVDIAPMLAHADDLERCAAVAEEAGMGPTAAEFRQAASEIRALLGQHASA